MPPIPVFSGVPNAGLKLEIVHANAVRSFVQSSSARLRQRRMCHKQTKNVRRSSLRLLLAKLGLDTYTYTCKYTLMPNITLYVKDSDTKILEKAREAAWR